MVDVTHDLLPEPYYYPMAPTVDDLVEYATEIDREGHCITFEWAVTEINNFSFSYVRIGLLANAVRRYRIYENPT
ncbi:hypothetical protein [Microseira wollei]|uniref:Uncharacterized protein n=1 Tax=Microseira wollei NIES-4236 TaxID=2530354 RepID=A0AAV3XE06_9CYAN|nr:hypothetical protein [Microseira wollei]GET40473.1 hypothetical protein MiSe_52820 [Microseira wollei NIES-4236]